jgi:hypothetical protein
MESEQMSPIHPKPIPPILPNEVMHWAWSLTIVHSGTKERAEVTEQEKQIRTRMSEVRTKVLQGKDPNDEKYMDAIFNAVDSCVRTLLVIIRGRDTNFKETDSLMDMYIKSNESISSFTLSLQSAFGRVAGMTFGGTSATAIVMTLFPNLPVWVFPLTLSAMGAISYALYELLVTPWKQKKNMAARIKNDYQRDIYFQQYVRRCRDALVGLLMNAFSIYKQVYGVHYDDSFKNIEIQRKFAENVVDDALGSLDLKYSCEDIHDCYDKKIFLTNESIELGRWATCESGEGNEKCPIFQKNHPNLKK